MICLARDIWEFILIQITFNIITYSSSRKKWGDIPSSWYFFPLRVHRYELPCPCSQQACRRTTGSNIPERNGEQDTHHHRWMSCTLDLPVEMREPLSREGASFSRIQNSVCALWAVETILPVFWQHPSDCLLWKTWTSAMRGRNREAHKGIELLQGRAGGCARRASFSKYVSLMQVHELNKRHSDLRALCRTLWWK